MLDAHAKRIGGGKFEREASHHGPAGDTFGGRLVWLSSWGKGCGMRAAVPACEPRNIEGAIEAGYGCAKIVAYAEEYIFDKSFFRNQFQLMLLRKRRQLGKIMLADRLGIVCRVENTLFG